MAIIGGINVGNLIDYLFFFADGNVDANWQGATKGFVGDVAVDGIQADERTSGTVPYAGTIYTNDVTLAAWQDIINQNIGQATGQTGEVARIAGLEADLINAIQQINALPATPGFESVSSTSLDGLNTQNGMNEVFVINVTSGFNFSSQINITGDAGDVFILRWDADADPTNGYQGQVKPQSGGAIVPHGGLKASNFIHVAGDINASGGGSTPAPPYPQGPRFNDGQGSLITGGSDFSGGGFFTGYWLTTGAPDAFDPGSGLFIGETQSLSNGIFVGGWYSLTTKFSMTSGTSGVYVSPNLVSEPDIDLEKLVSPDGGTTFFDADNPPGPNIPQGTNPVFRYIVTNTGNVTLTNITLTDDKLGVITVPQTTLDPGDSFIVDETGVWMLGANNNIATVTGNDGNTIVSDTDPANYVGTIEAPSIDVEKLVSPDNGITFFDADVAPGPDIPSTINPIFRYVVVNDGNVQLTNITLTDDVLGPIIIPTTTLNPGQFFIVDDTGIWAAGQNTNIATVTGDDNGNTLTDTDPANYFGVLANPAIDVEKLVSPDGGINFVDADLPPGPNVPQGTDPIFRYVVTNVGNVSLTGITLTDDILGAITIPTTTLAAGESFTVHAIGTWAAGPNPNIATVTGTDGTVTLTDTDPANYVGVAAEPAIDLEKFVSPDGGTTFVDADVPPGPNITQGMDPVFRYIVTNTGNTTLTNISLTDNILGIITIPVNTLAPAQSFTVDQTGTWAFGQNTNVATVTGHYGEVTLLDTDPANYVGVIVPTSFKQLSIDENVTIPPQKPNAEDILNTLVDVVILETRVIKTLIGTSEEGQILTGYKLIIEGMLHQKVEYIADEPTQTVHAAEFKVPFSSFIILPEDFIEDSTINVNAYIEDIYVKLLDKRNIFKNITLRLEAEIIC